jgi:hypothetical protein
VSFVLWTAPGGVLRAMDGHVLDSPGAVADACQDNYSGAIVQLGHAPDPSLQFADLGPQVSPPSLHE